jgi:hypothetical protein
MSGGFGTLSRDKNMIVLGRIYISRVLEKE